ncbi:MAG: alpha/beta hydrolase [Verrucomicrobiales bacterium]|nr:alpha/beta hydrolase [Verrucomicrobiales bacterium]
MSLPDARLSGELCIPADAKGLVVFAHGSGSSRHSPRNQFVAQQLQRAGLGTLLFDLLTAEEELAEWHTRHLRFNIPFLARRLLGVTRWAQEQTASAPLKLGYFGASTGAAAALWAAAELGTGIGAVVSRGGRPDLAEAVLPRVVSPTLLIVGEHDYPVIPLNETAFALLKCPKELRIVPRASHLFEEPGALESVADLARDWFLRYLPGPA